MISCLCELIRTKMTEEGAALDSFLISHLLMINSQFRKISRRTVSFLTLISRRTSVSYYCF